MRMWMVDPRRMCRKHLLGEHLEIHMLAGSLCRGRSIAGFIAANCTEPISANARHTALVKEMLRRGYKHQSPLMSVDASRYAGVKVDRMAALHDLTDRCAECAAGFKKRKPRQ